MKLKKVTDKKEEKSNGKCRKGNKKKEKGRVFTRAQGCELLGGLNGRIVGEGNI